MSERLVDRILHIFRHSEEATGESPIAAEPKGDLSVNGVTAVAATPPTMNELLARVQDRSHPSQQQFEPLSDGRMLPTCSQNGYTYFGYPLGSSIQPPRGSKFRAEVRMQTLQLPPKRRK